MARQKSMDVLGDAYAAAHAAAMAAPLEDALREGRVLVEMPAT
jgi:hypothetical protein